MQYPIPITQIFRNSRSNIFCFSISAKSNSKFFVTPSWKFEPYNKNHRHGFETFTTWKISETSNAFDTVFFSQTNFFRRKVSLFFMTSLYNFDLLRRCQLWQVSACWCFAFILKSSKYLRVYWFEFPSKVWLMASNSISCSFGQS